VSDGVVMVRGTGRREIPEMPEADAALMLLHGPALVTMIERQVRAMDGSPMSDINYAGLDWLRDARAALASVKGDVTA
jgi:hypothetical protein